MIREILKMGDPRLLRVAPIVPAAMIGTAELDALIVDMFDTMHAADGVGLAAPQIGVDLQLVIFGFDDNERYPEAPAVPQVAEIFGDAIRKMTLSDARGILTGGDHAATDFFRRVAGDALTARIHPIVARTTDSVGVTQKYKSFTSGSAGGELGGLLGSLGGGKSNRNGNALDLDDYVTKKTLDGLFTIIGEQEQSIRHNPGARTTDLLKKVFGGR